ncbi:hypothetical protein ACTHGU_14315 [Chitinophagaceae bacterium MMS25-I14]
MKNFLKILVGNLVAVLAIYLLSVPSCHIGTGRDDITIALGLIFLLVSIFNFLFGAILMFSPERRPFGLSMLLFAAIALLCSFTLCSTSTFNL